jgi:hypothetical protein
MSSPPAIKISTNTNVFKNVTRLERGASLKAADKPFGISNSKSQIANLKFEIWHLRFRA